MTSKTTYLLGIFAVIVLGTLLYLNLCSGCIKDQDQKGAVPKASFSKMPLEDKTIGKFSISDGDFVLDVKDNFNFRVSKPSFLMPISDDLKQGIVDLKGYLEANPEKKINIVGFYAENEENTSSFSDLGVARANSVKNQLVVSGISSNRITAEGQLMLDVTAHEGIFLGPISFQTVDKDSTEQNQQ